MASVKFLSVWLSLFAIIYSQNTSSVQYPSPLPCTGEGCTQISYSIQDSSIIRHTNGTYFRFSKSEDIGLGLSLATAPQVSGPWQQQAPVLGPNVTLLDPIAQANRSNTHLWTPEVHYIQGIYYLFYSIAQISNTSQPSGFDICVATSTTMDTNSWTDHGAIGVSPPTYDHEYAAIDQNIVVNVTTPFGVDPAYQVCWGSFNAGLFCTNINATNPLKVNSGESPRLTIQDQPVPVNDPGTIHGNNRTEGSFQHHVNGYYYYYYSQGSCCTGPVEDAYVTYVCRSTSSTGPFLSRNGTLCGGYPNGTLGGNGTVVLASHLEVNGEYQVLAPGSVNIVETPSEGLIFTYQYRNQSAPAPVPITLYFGHNYLGFDSDLWPFLANTSQPLPSH